MTKKRGWRRFTDAERQWLIEHAAKMTIDQMANCLQRPPNTLRKHCAELGLEFIVLRKLWSAEHLQYIRDNPSTPLSVQAKHLRRTMRAVYNQRHIMGIVDPAREYRHRWTTKEVNFCRDNGATMTLYEMAAALGRSVNSMKGLLKSKKIKYRLLRWPWTKAEIEFLKNNRDMLLVEQSRLLGRSKTTIAKKRLVLGLSRKHQSVELINRVKAMLRPGIVLADLGAKYGFSAEVLRQRAVQMGYVSRKGRLVWPHDGVPLPPIQPSIQRTITPGIRGGPNKKHCIPTMQRDRDRKRLSAAELDAMAHPRSRDIARSMDAKITAAGRWRFIPLADGTRIRVLKK